jgi:hypothetical protein
MTVVTPDSYSYERCGLCKGMGKGGLGTNEPCPPFKATGKVLVHQPPVKCPRCQGRGEAPDEDVFVFGLRVCIICRSSGWVMTLMD